jgi:hypothetical protein
MVVSQTIESMSLTATARSFSAMLVFGCVLELAQTLVPEIAQQRTQFSQTLGASAVQATCTGAPLLDQAGFTQDAQVLRDRGTGDIRKASGDLARRILLVADQAQDGNPARLAERVEDGGVAQHSYLSGVF